MVSVACKTDEDDQVVVATVVEFSVGRSFDRLDMLFAFLSPLQIGFLGDFCVWLKPHRSRINTIDAIGGSYHLALAVVHGIAVIAAFAFHNGKTVGIMQVVIELVARCKTFDNLAIRLGEANGDVL